jgi:hypothetical protein
MQKKILALIILIPFSLSFANSVDIWYGGQFDGFAWNDVMEVTPGQWIDIPVYALGNSDDINIADMMLALGINKQYIDQFSIEDCRVLEPLTTWDVAVFSNENDEFKEGWSSLSFLGFSQIYSEDTPYGHFETPTKIMTFRVHIVDDEKLMNEVTPNAIAEGMDIRQECANMGNPGGDLSYEVKQHFASLLFSPATGIDDQAAIPDVYFLSENYPNPFNPKTLFKYGIPEAAHVTIEVYDVLGRRVETLINKEQEAGYHQVTFDGDGYSSGMYFFKMAAGDYNETKKMTLIK